MRAFARVIGWVLLGSLIVGTTVLAGFLLSYRLFEPSADSEIRGWLSLSR